MLAWTPFVNPIEFAGQPLWLLPPIALAVAAVYKTIRVKYLADLPRAILLLTLYIVAGSAGLMFALYLFIRLT